MIEKEQEYRASVRGDKRQRNMTLHIVYIMLNELIGSLVAADCLYLGNLSSMAQGLV